MEKYKSNVNGYSSRGIRYEEHSRLVNGIREKLQHIFRQHRVTVNEVSVADSVLNRSAYEVLSSLPEPPNILGANLQKDIDEIEEAEVKKSF